MATIDRILKLSKLSAAEKRGATDFLKGLTPNRVQLIETIARETANFEISEFTNNMSETLDRSICASLVLNLNLPYSDIIDSLSKAYELVEEDTELVKKIKVECGGSFDMVKKKLGEFEAPVRDKCMELLTKGIKDVSKALIILQSDFPKLSKSMLTNAFAKVKEEYQERQVIEEVQFDDQEEKEAAEKIVDIICNTNSKDVVKDQVEENQTLTNNKFEEDTKMAENKKNALKVKKIEIEGANGTYLVNEEGVMLTANGDVISFQNEAELKEWVDEVKAVFNLRAATN